MHFGPANGTLALHLGILDQATPAKYMAALGSRGVFAGVVADLAIVTGLFLSCSLLCGRRDLFFFLEMTEGLPNSPKKGECFEGKPNEHHVPNEPIVEVFFGRREDADVPQACEAVGDFVIFRVEEEEGVVEVGEDPAALFKVPVDVGEDCSGHGLPLFPQSGEGLVEGVGGGTGEADEATEGESRVRTSVK
jgi:hypothetical protein